MHPSRNIDSTELFNSNILVIDDEEINLSIVEELLLGEGFKNVTTEQEPLKAIELYKSNDYDVVLLDISMPEIDGFEVLKRFNDIDKDIPPPVLVITALTNQSVCNQALSSGATDFLYKPFNLEEAVNRITNILNLHLIEKKLFDTNALLEERVNLRTQELYESKLKVIEHLGHAAEYRDNETAAHTIRVGEYAKLLGQAVGLSESALKLLHRAAPLHDIGKIGIPDAILLKPGKFEPEEWEVMKRHTEIGGQILEKNDDPLIQKGEL